VPKTKKKSESKTNAKAIDNMLRLVQERFNISDKDIKDILKEHLPASSSYIKKKPKDPNAPKKALTPYMLYANSVRDDVKRSAEGISFQDITREIGKRWRGLSAEQKVPYEEQHLRLKAEYDVKKTEYLSAHPQPEKSNQKSTTTKPRIQKDHTGNPEYVKDHVSGKFFKRTSGKGKSLAEAEAKGSASASA